MWSMTRCGHKTLDTVTQISVWPAASSEERFETWKKEDEGYVRLESDTLTFLTVRALVVHSVDFFKPLTFNTNAKWARVCIHGSAT